MTLRRRLYVAAAVVAVVFAAVGVLLVRSVETSEVAQLDQQMQVSFQSINVNGFVARSAGAGQAVAKGAPAPQFAPPGYINDLYVASVKAGQRQTISKPLDGNWGLPQTPSVTSVPPATNFKFVTVQSRVGMGPWRAVLVRLPGSNDQLLMARSLAPADGTVSRVRLTVIGAGLFILLVMAAAGFWVGRLGLRPIAEVTAAADGIAAGQRARRVTGVKPGTEAGHLAQAFNVMLDEQQALEDRLRQFVADASHELRTPLSAIQGIAELWRGGDLRQGKAADDAMRRIGQESARMSNLVEGLLLLARLDEGQPLNPTSVDLVAPVRDAIADLSTTHPSRTISLDAGAEEMTAVVDAAAIRQVVVNLITNAVTYTPPTASVTVRLVQQAGQAVLEVTDSGPGMDDEGVAHAFDRFWRADSARTTAGSGLGLSIVRGIASAHGGQVSLTSDPSKGTTVRVVLPTALPCTEG